MLEKIPTPDEISALLDNELAWGAWIQVSSIIKSHYNMDEIWSTGGKAWDYEYKFRKGGKTLCALYARNGEAGILIIFGKAERESFELSRKEFSDKVQDIYDNAKTFHDGKWVMFPLNMTINPMELEKLLFIKKKPNKKLLNGAKHYTLKEIRDGASTSDILYSYKRKSEVKNQTFRFTFEFDLNREIKELDLADMIIYCCQRDLKMQELMQKYNYGETSSLNDFLLIANEYREKLLKV